MDHDPHDPVGDDRLALPPFLTAAHEPPSAPSALDAAAFVRMLEASGDAIAVLDREWRYFYLNDLAEALHGRPRSEMLGRRVVDVFPGIESTVFWHTYQRAVREQALLTVEEYFEPLGKWFDVRAIPHGDFLYVHFRDVTAQITAAERDRERETRERSLLTRIFHQAPAFMAALRGPTHIFEMVNPPYQQLVAHRDILGKPVAEAIPEVVGQGFIDLLDRVYATGEPYAGREVPIWLQTVADGPLEERFLDFTYQPLHDDEGRITGVLAHGIDLTERKRAEEALRNAQAELARRVRNHLAIVESAVDSLARYDRDLRLVFVNPAFERYTGFMSEQVVGKTLREVGFPEETAATWEETFRQVFATGEPLRTEVVLKSFRTGETRYYERVITPEFDPSCSGTVSTILTFSRDITERKRAERREALINQIGDGIRQSLAPEEIESLAIQALGAALGADRCYLMTVDITHDRITISRDWSIAGVDSIAGDYRISDLGVDFEALFRAGATLTVPDTRRESERRLSDRNADTNARLQVTSFLNVPFYEGDRIVGALGVAMATAARDWAPDEIALAETVAGQLRSVLEAARTQQRERNIAQQLQEALQPPTLPPLPGLALASYYRPALSEASVGGDFFDVFATGDGRSALVVADLSGKGLAAAQQVATVRNMLRFAVYTAPTTADAVTSLHRILVERELLTGFATLFVGQYDHRDRTLTYVNCGQEPGLIWRNGTGAIETLPPSGPVLGGFASMDFTQRSVVLRPDDVLALFTDGLTEAGPNRSQLLEIPGISRLLGSSCAEEPAGQRDPQRIVHRMIAGVERAARGGLRDDIALLIGVASTP